VEEAVGMWFKGRWRESSLVLFLGGERRCVPTAIPESLRSENEDEDDTENEISRIHESQCL